MLLLCYYLTLWLRARSSLCPEAFVGTLSLTDCNMLCINILYIYTFNYLYLKLSSFPVFAAALYSFLSSVRFAFMLFFSSLPCFISDKTSAPLSWFLFLLSVFAYLLVCPFCLVWVGVCFSLASRPS